MAEPIPSHAGTEAPTRQRRVLVTGALGGFGVPLCAALRRAGHQVVGLDLREGEDVLACDLRREDSVREAVARAVQRLGGLDVLVNNAGIGGSTDASSPPDQHALTTFEVNVFGTWRMTAAALPHLLEAAGRVVNVSSGLAFVSLPHTAAYCASKRAIVAYGEVLQAELGDRLEVSTVYPGYVRTAIHSEDPDAPSLDGIAREERLEDVVETLMRACVGPHRRELATTRRTGMELSLARHAPWLVRWILAQRAGKAR
jgi:NAD(P)-dependent dehydrogenase (short-subunit alcohol dehydrogenase family)